MARGNMDWHKVQKQIATHRPVTTDPGFRRITLAQRALIRQLEKETNTEPTDLTGMSLVQASELIVYLKSVR